MGNRVWVVLCVAALFTPLFLLAAMGEAAHGFDGERDYTRPAFSANGFLSGRFQADFERWFSTKYPLRPRFVEAYGALDARKDAFAFAAPALSLAAEAQTAAAPRFPEYALAPEAPTAPDGFRGTANVVVGSQGYLYENGYINEYLGYARKYAEVTDAQLWEKTRWLAGIQESLAARGVAFCLVITPSKASALPQYIPGWYLAKYTAEPGYARPYTRFVEQLAEEGVFFVDAARVLRGVGMTNIFPKASTHWNKMAAYETTAAVIAEYQRQTGRATKGLAADRVVTASEPPGFGNGETDIFGIVYAGRKAELETAVRDEAYYWPEVYAADTDKPGLPPVLLQGGSFADDIAYYLGQYGVAPDLTAFRYNNSGDAQVDWAGALDGVGFVLLEVNEQFVHNLGGNGPSFGQSDFAALKPGANIVESLYAYLKGHTL